MKKKNPKQSITTLRDQIDRVDDRILFLLNRRASLVETIQELKRERSVPVYAPQRETEIVQRLIASNKGPLSKKEVKFLFQQIIQFFRERQRLSSKGLQNKR